MFENGHGGVNSDHTPFDAMVNVVMSHFIGKICLLFNMCFRLSCLGFTASNSISSQYSVPWHNFTFLYKYDNWFKD